MMRATAALVVCLTAATNGFAADPAIGDGQEANEFMLPVMSADRGLSRDTIQDVAELNAYDAEGEAKNDATSNYDGEPARIDDEGSQELTPEGGKNLPQLSETDGDFVNSCETCYCVGPTWFARVEALWLKRNRVRPMTLSVDDRSPGGDVIVADTDALGFDYQPGARLTIGHYLNDCRTLELSYFSVDRWTSSAKTPFSPGGDIDPFWGNDLETIDLRNFSGAFQHFYRYESKLHNAEVNIREIRDADSSVLAGLRYIQIDEDFRFLSFDSDNAVIALNPDDVGLYDIDARNHLVGLQVGGEKRWGAGHVQIGARGKAGVFLNFHEQTSVLIDINQQNVPRARTNLRTENDDVGFSTVLDLGLFATCRLSDCLSLRAGYDVFFISNVALAPEQLDVPQWINSRNKLSNNGSVIYHGPSAGLQMTW